MVRFNRLPDKRDFYGFLHSELGNLKRNTATSTAGNVGSYSGNGAGPTKSVRAAIVTTNVGALTGGRTGIGMSVLEIGRAYDSGKH